MPDVIANESEIELFPGSSGLSEPVFPSFQDYERFREDFYESVRADLEELAEARRVSEEEAMCGRRCERRMIWPV